MVLILLLSSTLPASCPGFPTTLQRHRREQREMHSCSHPSIVFDPKHWEIIIATLITEVYILEVVGDNKGPWTWWVEAKIGSSSQKTSFHIHVYTAVCGKSWSWIAASPGIKSSSHSTPPTKGLRLILNRNNNNGHFHYGCFSEPGKERRMEPDELFWCQWQLFPKSAVQETTAFSSTAKATLILKQMVNWVQGCHWGSRGALKKFWLLHSWALPPLCCTAPWSQSTNKKTIAPKSLQLFYSKPSGGKGLLCF